MKGACFGWPFWFFYCFFYLNVFGVSLHEAIYAHDSNTAVNEIKKGSALGEINGKNSMTALHLASYKGNYEVCVEILKRNSDYLNKFVIIDDSNILLTFFSILIFLPSFSFIQQTSNKKNAITLCPPRIS